MKKRYLIIIVLLVLLGLYFYSNTINRVKTYTYKSDSLEIKVVFTIKKLFNPNIIKIDTTYTYTGDNIIQYEQRILGTLRSIKGGFDNFIFSYQKDDDRIIINSVADFNELDVVEYSKIDVQYEYFIEGNKLNYNSLKSYLISNGYEGV